MNPPLALLAAVALLGTVSIAHGADAKDNWNQYCAKCHGVDGAGKTKMGQHLKVKDYTDAKVQGEFSDDQLLKVTLEGSTRGGRQLMKGYKDDLSEADAKALVAYLRSLKK